MPTRSWPSAASSVPDILCNSGGVIVSYFEWVQNLQSFSWPGERVAESSSKSSATPTTKSPMLRRRGIDARLAAQAIAVGRVAEASEIRGRYP